MANPAQLVNTIHSLFHTYEDKFILTPNYHVFEMYMPHAGATAVRTEFISPQVKFTRLDAARKEVPVSFWGLNGSASINGNTVTLTVVNPDTRVAREAGININGATIVSASMSERRALRNVLRRCENAAETVRAKASGTANAGSRRTPSRATADQTRGAGVKAPGPTSNRRRASIHGASITVSRPYSPLPGAANVTDAPGTGVLLTSLTIALSAVGNAVLMGTLWPAPAVAVMLAGTPGLLVRLKLAGVATFGVDAITL